MVYQLSATITIWILWNIVIDKSYTIIRSYRS